MAHTIQRAEYYYTTVHDRPGEAFRFLSALGDIGVNLLAFTAMPVGVMQTQLMIFPEDGPKLERQSARVGLEIEGPHGAILVLGDDVPGALVEIHETLYERNINVYASTGVTGGGGCYGYIIHVRPDDFEAAAEALGA
ncbi:MAG: hypothetical protein PVI57_23505 [Gemmatimonadota bacterium]|jgi:hypothetical protein